MGRTCKVYVKSEKPLEITTQTYNRYAAVQYARVEAENLIEEDPKEFIRRANISLILECD